MTHYFKVGLLAILIFLSYSGHRLFPHFKGQDPEVSSYVSEFKDLGKNYGLIFPRDPSIGFERIGGKVVGHCFRTLTTREIALDRGSWERATGTTRRMLAYHELTHCYCSREHDLRQMHDGCPASLMFPQIVNDECAILHYTHYTTEMFARCKPYK